MSIASERIHRSRRRFLTSAASGLGAVALASLLREEGLLAASGQGRVPHHAPRATACIFIFLGGGMSQLDMFDPKPKLQELAGQPLPESMRRNVRFAFIRPDAPLRPSSHRFTQHGGSGLSFSELVPHLATRADDLCVVRSLTCGVFNHLPAYLFMNTGYEAAGHPSVGAWVLYGLGSPSRDLPGYVVLNSRRRVTGGPANWSSGYLPSRYQGVPFRNEGAPILDLENPEGITPAAQRHTVEAMRRLTDLQRGRAADAELDSAIARYELAFRLQSAGPELVDLASEPAHVREAYGLERQQDATGYNFARHCLLARRLVERGVRFVTLFDGGWDQHNNLDERLAANCRRVDQPIAALLTDLKQRGLLDETLVVVGSEFGRTPLTEGPHDQPRGGRDHHPYAFTTLMAGGGVRPGHAHGATDELGWRVTEDAVDVHDFHATLLHLFGMDHERLTYRTQGRQFRLTDVHGRVVRGVLA